MNNGEIIGDDSCQHANDGVCHDGGPGSVFFEDADGRAVSACKYATDATDCPLRLMEKLGPLSYGISSAPPAPVPPPSSPSPPGLPPPSFTYVACDDTCSYAGSVCSDGGNSALI